MSLFEHVASSVEKDEEVAAEGVLLDDGACGDGESVEAGPEIDAIGGEVDANGRG